MQKPEHRLKMPELEFWFDFASCYSYIAAMRIEAMCLADAVKLDWKPFLLGPIFELQGWNDSHFNLNPRRGGYMWRDMERLTDKFSLPFQRPSVFPRKSTLPGRVACAIGEESWSGEFIRRVFVANFGDDREIDELSVITDILEGLGKVAQPILDRALTEQRGLLRANTQHAIELGIFGAPNCVVNGELFWGEETLEDAIRWLKRV
jgi:2-hydroxychromene-2-carboxylate isomerase